MNLTNQIGLIVLSDAHINSSVGLTTPAVTLDDGGTYRASRAQRALYESFRDYVTQAEQLTQGMTRVVLLNGDIGELDTKRRSTQLISQNKATILRLVVDTLEPILAIADHVIVVRGTMAHVGKASWLEESIAADFDHAIPSADGVFSWYHFRGVLGGVKVDAAHHGRMGSVPWTVKNAGNRLAAETFWNYSRNGWELPDIVIRSHNHRRSDSGRNYAPMFAMFTPAWQLMTEFGYRIGAENSLADIGGDVYTIDSGKWEWHPIDYKPQKATKVWQALKI